MFDLSIGYSTQYESIKTAGVKGIFFLLFIGI